MSLPEILPALPAPQAVMEVGAYAPARHPVLAYLGRLNTPISRESMLRRLNIVARLLTDDTSEALHFRWERVTYVVLSAVRATLMQTSAPATCNVTLAAIKGVIRECWRLGYLSAEEMQRACAVPPVPGSGCPPAVPWRRTSSASCCIAASMTGGWWAPGMPPPSGCSMVWGSGRVRPSV